MLAVALMLAIVELLILTDQLDVVKYYISMP